MNGRLPLDQSLAQFEQYCEQHGRPGMFSRFKDKFIEDYNNPKDVGPAIDLVHNPMTGEVRGGYADYEASRPWNEE